MEKAPALPSDDLLKLAIVGELESRKTALLTRLAHAPHISSTFFSNYVTKFGHTSRYRRVLLDGTRLNVVLWLHQDDQEARKCWQTSHGVVYVCSPTNQEDEELQRICDHIEAIRQELKEIPIIFAVDKRKTDTWPQDNFLKKLRERTNSEVQVVCSQTGAGVEALLLSITRKAIKYKWQRDSEIKDTCLPCQKTDQPYSNCTVL